MAEWKKLVVSGSAISQLNNDAGYITEADIPASSPSFATASFDGTHLLADSTSGSLNFASGSGTGLTISADAVTDTLTFSLSEIPNDSLLNDSITFGTDEVFLGETVDQMSLTGFTGSFTGSLVDGTVAVTQEAGDSSTLVATTEFVTSAVGDFSSILAISSSDDNTNDGIDLKDEALNFAGTSEDVDVTINPGSNEVKIGLRDDVTIQQDLVVNRNLTVLGTASFQSEKNLLVTDRFILLASGSSQTGDGGIIVQQDTQGFGEVFGFDGIAGEERWGIGQSQDATSTSFSPEAFMAAVLTGSATSDSEIDALVDARYHAKGNIFIGDNQDIWIWS